jgi:uncharacterized protein (DUF433 family)
MPVAVPSHITVDEKGSARIDNTRFKVVHLIEAWKAGASTPEMLHDAYPQLTMGQIHAALAYYYDHQAELDSDIERRLKDYKAARANSEETPGRKKLRDMGLRP